MGMYICIFVCPYMYIYIFMYVNVGSRILWPVCRDHSANSGVDLHWPSCLSRGLIYDHNALTVSILSDFTRRAGSELVSIWKGDIFSSLHTSGYLAQVWGSFLSLPPISSQEVWDYTSAHYTSCYVWVPWIRSSVLKLVEAAFLPGDSWSQRFSAEDCISQVLQITVEVTSVPLSRLKTSRLAALIYRYTWIATDM